MWPAATQKNSWISDCLHLCNRVGATETREGFIRCVLDAGSGCMESASCLRKKLGKEKTIWHMCHGVKNQFRPHRDLRKDEWLAQPSIRLLHVRYQRSAQRAIRPSDCIHGIILRRSLTVFMFRAKCLSKSRQWARDIDRPELALFSYPLDIVFDRRRVENTGDPCQHFDQLWWWLSHVQECSQRNGIAFSRITESTLRIGNS